MTKRSIPTEYGGEHFRSKLEADWARFFDALGIKWVYEKEGQYFGQQFYLVDFYLPTSRQYVEVKAVFEPDDVRKIASLLRYVDARPHTNGDDCPDIAIVTCEPKGVFRGWSRNAHLPLGINVLELSRRASRDLRGFACTVCGGWWFADDSLSWRCQCCGASSGNAHIAADFGSPIRGFPDSPDIRPVAPDFD